MISDPIVVRIFVGEYVIERESTKIKILEALKIGFGVTLTRNSNSLILCKNQVNVPSIAMAEALYLSGARICIVRFFGMKMPIGLGKPLIDNLVHCYLEILKPEVEARVLQNKSVFDIGTVSSIDSIDHEILGTRLEVTVQGVDTVQAAR